MGQGQVDAFPGPVAQERANLPDIAEINRRNGEFWKATSSQSVSAGGGPAATPAPGSSGTGKGASFQPNAAGSIDVPAHFSNTPKQMEQKTWGVDADSLRAGDMHRRATARTNQLVEMIQPKNAAFYGRKG